MAADMSGCGKGESRSSTTCLALAALLTVASCAPHKPVSMGAAPARATAVPALVASASASAMPVTEPTPAEEPTTKPRTTGVPEACRAGRLTFEEAVERCSVSSDRRADALPDAVHAEIGGPGELAGDELGKFELQLVNRTNEVVPLILRITCNPNIYALDAAGAHVVRHETSGEGELGSQCSGRGFVVSVELEPGGMLVAPFSWKAERARTLDGRLRERHPLTTGTYELRAFTWFTLAKPEDEGKTHGAELAVVAAREIRIR